MNILKNISLPAGINYDNPASITREKIKEYYDSIYNYYGNFCGDCKYLNENKTCEKGYRPRKYQLEIGPDEFVILRKNCKAFSLYKSEIDVDNVNLKINNTLDCNVQQYG